MNGQQSVLIGRQLWIAMPGQLLRHREGHAGLGQIANERCSQGVEVDDSARFVERIDPCRSQIGLEHRSGMSVGYLEQRPVGIDRFLARYPPLQTLGRVGLYSCQRLTATERQTILRRPQCSEVTLAALRSGLLSSSRLTMELFTRAPQSNQNLDLLGRLLHSLAVLIVVAISHAWLLSLEN